MHFPKMPVPSLMPGKRACASRWPAGWPMRLRNTFALPQGFWAVVTAIMLIQQPRIGGTVQAGIDRFIGTIVGALVGFLVAPITPSTTLGTAVRSVVSIGVLGMLASARCKLSGLRR